MIEFVIERDIRFEKNVPIKKKISHFINAVKRMFQRPEVIPFVPTVVKRKGEGFHYKGKEFIHHSKLDIVQTAFHRLSGIQILTFLMIFTLFVLAFVTNWHLALMIIVALLTVIYFADLLFNLFLIHRSFSRSSEIYIDKKEIFADKNRDWPLYSILCPLYKEGNVISQFVEAIGKLDYPKDKLQVILLLEEDDTQTIATARKFSLPSYFQIAVVPHSLPKTKPKAINYGLKLAKGVFTVVYDAEDMPDPLQLKKVVLAFEQSKGNVVCIQAKLNFYNPRQNILTRLFTAEYSLWFDLVLTGLQSIGAPIPLGGTSNHFFTRALHKLKGWDAFNVTEDCDLGIRIAKQGYSTAIINSTTYEEANSQIGNWFSQRSRWIKGYMQTYLVHTRSLLDFLKLRNKSHAITFQLVVGGKVMSMFINPFMWVITICYFAFRSHVAPFIESFFPAPVLYIGVVSLLVGNFLYMYYYMIGCIKREHHNLVKYIIFIPFYWLAMSVATWVAFYKLLTAPHHWSKTKHGLHLSNKNKPTVKQAAHSYPAQVIPAIRLV